MKLSEADVSELRGTTSLIEEEGDYRITAPPGDDVVATGVAMLGERQGLR